MLFLSILIRIDYPGLIIWGTRALHIVRTNWAHYRGSRMQNQRIPVIVALRGALPLESGCRRTLSLNR
jgi:hypothetical protein